VRAAVARPILGSDFFAKYRLLVDSATNSVLDASTLLPIGDTVPDRRSKLVASLSVVSPPVRSLLSAFPNIVGDGTSTPQPLHGVEHSVETKGRPIWAKARRLDPDKLRVAEAEFRALEKMCIVRRSNSSWSSPLHMVPKQDGSFRPCGDYRRLNTVTEDDKYPLPSLLDFSADLAGCTVFSKLDLVKGYHQIPMSAADIPKTAICTPFGLFEYLFMPFGLKNAAQTFQRLMDRLFRHLPFVFVYLDDILVASRSDEEHLDHLRQVFEILQKNGLQINPVKCVFSVPSLSFLGHMVNAAGITPLPKHVKALQDFPPPSDLKQLQRFLGMINFYRRFLPGIAGILRPLTDLLRGNPKKLLWSDLASAAFAAGKAALVSCTALAHPSPNAVVSLAVDASDSHVGGVLQQLSGSPSPSWQPLAFFSRKLSTAETRYSAFDRELLAAFAAVKHFRFVLEGRKFTLLTDHKPLTLAMHRVSPPASARQGRHLAFVSEFTTDLRHIAGKSNVVADALSRPSSVPPPVQATVQSSTLLKKPFDIFSEARTTKNNSQQQLQPPATSEDDQPVIAALPVATTPVDYTLMAHLQSTCPDVARMCDSTSLFIVERVVEGDIKLLGDISTGCFRPLVPAELRLHVMESLHAVAHPGVRATVRLVSSKFCWPRLAAEVSQFARQCLFCQRGKVSTHVHLTPVTIPVPARRFEHVHVDLVGPLPSSGGSTYLFTVVDRTTRWPEAIPLSNITAADCAAALFAGWIQRFGVPGTITSDRGAQFTSALWASLCQLLCINHIQTTAYHPQANGLVERFHRRLKDSLRARLAGPDWNSHLPWVLLGIPTSVPLEGGLSPAEAVMGCQPVLPGQFLEVGEPPLATFLDTLRSTSLKVPRQTSHKNTPLPESLPNDLALADYVFVRRDGVSPPLSPLYDGPFQVLRRSTHTFQLQIGNKVDTVSTHRLKTCHMPPGAAAAVPARRGRPPAVQPSPVGASSPNQNPGEKTSSQKHVEQTTGSSLKKCPQRVNSNGKNPSLSPVPPPVRRGRPLRGSGSNTPDPQPTLRQQQTRAPRDEATHTIPALPSQMRQRSGQPKRVSFSLLVTIIPQTTTALPDTYRHPETPSVSGRPIRSRHQPDRLGVSLYPLASRLGGEL